MRHGYECRVRWSDVDSYGHVNNVKYFEYFQEARIAFFSRIAEPDPGRTERFVVARLEVDYRRPILFRPEPFMIESWVSRLGTSSYDIEAEIRDGDEVLSRSQAVIVAYDLAAGRSRPLNDREREVLSAARDSA
ncbi:MAG: acyl-CoA thioesterase [Propionibacteriales bacterium]|nr:acyl-CoA thioesterase [Propionibacteriales bacterium]